MPNQHCDIHDEHVAAIATLKEVANNLKASQTVIRNLLIAIFVGIILAIVSPHVEMKNPLSPKSAKANITQGENI